MEISSLDINIDASVKNANSLDTLSTKLETLAKSVMNVNNAGFSKLTSSLGRLSTNMSRLKSEDITKVVDNLKKLESLKFSDQGNGVVEFTSALARLGNSNISNLTANLPQLANALKQFFATMSQTPTVDQNIIDMTNALANLGNSVQAMSDKAEKGASKSKVAISSVTSVVTGIGQIVNSNGIGGVISGVSTMMAAIPGYGTSIALVGNAVGMTIGAVENKFKSLISTVASFTKTLISIGSGTAVLNKLSSLIGSMYQKFFLLYRIVKRLWSAIESAFDYTEAYNYYNVALNKIATDMSNTMADAGEDSATSYYDSFSSQLETLMTQMTGYTLGDSGELLETGSVGLGINPTQLVQYQAQIGSITSSMGLLGQTSIDAERALSMLSADYSSLTNQDLSTTMQKFQSGLLGQSRALYSLGIDITQTSLAQVAYNHGVSKSVSSMTQAEKAQLRLIAILEQSRVAWGDIGNTINSASNQFRSLKQNVSQVARVIGQLLLPIAQKLLPVLNAVMSVLRNLLTTLGVKLYGEDWLKNIQDGISSADFSDLEEDIDDTTDSLDDATSSAKALKGQLQGFDELNNISTDDSSSSGSGSGSGGTVDLSSDISSLLEDYQAVWDKAIASTSNKAQVLANEIQKYINADNWEGLGSSISNYITKSLNKIEWDKVQQAVNKVGRRLADFLNGLITPDSLSTLGMTMANGFNTALSFVYGFLTNYKFDNLGNSIVSGVGSYFENINWSTISSAVMKLANGLADLIKTTFSNTFNDKSIFDNIGDFVARLLNEFTLFLTRLNESFSGDDLTNIGDSIADGINTFTSTFKSGELMNQLSILCSNIVTVVFEILKKIDWVKLFNDLFTVVMRSLWIVLHPYITYLGVTIGKNLGTIKNVIENWWNTKIVAWFEEKKEKIGTKITNLILSITTIITTGWEKIKSWWNENVKLPDIKMPTLPNLLGAVKNMVASVKSWFSKNCNLGTLTGKVEDFRTKVNNAIINVRTWFSNHSVLGTLTVGVQNFVATVQNMLNNLKNWWNNNCSLSEITSRIKLPHISIDWDTDSLTAKYMKKLGLKGFPSFRVSYYANGGFPEDGWFRASHGEMLGKFDNGQSVVANNNQIVEGIRQGVADGQSVQNQLLREQNELLTQILQKNTGISASDLFNSVRQSNKSYYRQTGKSAFVY